MASPFAPLHPPEFVAIPGIELGVAETGSRYKNRLDLLVIRAAPGSSIAGVFTQNRMPGAPVDWTKKALQVSTDTARLVIVNAGNANVFTGSQGRDACRQIAEAAAHEFAVTSDSVCLASTGVIGLKLDPDPITKGLTALKETLRADAWPVAAQAILTTDTYAKGAVARAEIDGVPVTVQGIAKGSGMIAPDMATMLSFIVTDANLDSTVLQNLLSAYSAMTFNAVTVDSDTSTSDMVLLIASRKANHNPVISGSDPRLDGFKDALLKVMLDLAHQIVKDGEGAQKFISVRVSGAITDVSARNVARSIANSPLVKTAIAGEDANWGRIVMAVGKAGEPAERENLSVFLGPHLLAQNGELSASYQEKDGAEYMQNSEIDIHVDLGMGSGEFTVWTCDLTHDYININADYRS